jgi:hypothetical protein
MTDHAAAPGEPLATGWEADASDTDTIARAAIRNMADRIVFTAERMGGESREWGDLCAVCFGEGSTLWVNVATVLAPQDTGDPDLLADRLDEFFGPTTPATVFSPLPTADLRQRGYLAMGHPPLMLRLPGGSPPPDPSGLEVVEVNDAETLAEWEQTEADGFPLDRPGKFPRGGLFDERVLDGPLRFFLGRVDGTPATAAAVYVSRGVNQVEFVATLPEFRGRGFGEAVTWRSTLAEPDLPAVLIASDLGRPVYERMGFVSLFRYTGWIKPGG